MLVVIPKAGSLKCAQFGLSGCPVKPRRFPGRRGFTRQSETPNLCETTETQIWVKNGLAKIGFGQIGRAQNTMAKKWTGQNWSNQDGPKWIGHKKVSAGPSLDCYRKYSALDLCPPQFFAAFSRYCGSHMIFFCIASMELND